MTTLKRAAATAAADGQQYEALSFLRHALTMNPTQDERLELLLAIGAIEQLINPRRAACRLSAAFEAAPEPEKLRVAAGYADVLLQNRRARDAIDVLERAVNTAAGGSRTEDMAAAAGKLLCIAQLLPGSDMTGLIEKYGPVASSHSSGARLVDVVRAIRSTTQEECAALVPGTAIENDMLGFLYQGLSLVWTERFDLLEALLADVATDGNPCVYRVRLTLHALADQRRGRLAGAYAQADALCAKSDDSPDDPLRALQLSLLVDCAHYSGADDDISPAPPAETDMWPWILHRASLARARALSGDVESAARELVACGEALASCGMDNPAVLPWREEAAMLFLQLGDPIARSLAEEAMSRADRWGSPRARGIALRSYAMTQEGDDKVRALRKSVEALSDSADVLELCRSKIDLGRAYMTAGRTAEARSVLYSAHGLAQQLRATSLVDVAHRVLIETGARPRRYHAVGPEALTYSERRVADMAALGLSNSEIGQRLFITPRTVETHLTRTYRKLGIGSRSQLARALGLDSPD